MPETMTERVPLPQAAKELGVAQQSVREHMKSGKWDIGCVIEPKKEDGNCQYHIYRNKLDRHIGKSDNLVDLLQKANITINLEEPNMKGEQK